MRMHALFAEALWGKKDFYENSSRCAVFQGVLEDTGLVGNRQNSGQAEL